MSCHANAARGFVVTDEVLKYLLTHPPAIGIVMEENTMLVLKPSATGVFGKGSVAIVEPTKDKTKPWLRLVAGERRDFGK